jgi:hypothetical protein
MKRKDGRSTKTYEEKKEIAKKGWLTRKARRKAPGKPSHLSLSSGHMMTKRELKTLGRIVDAVRKRKLRLVIG